MKRSFSFVLVVMLCLSFSLSAFASTGTDKWLQSSKYEIQKDLWSRQNSIADALYGIADWVDGQSPDFYPGGGTTRGGGAGRRPFYTSASEGSSYKYNGAAGSGASQNVIRNSGPTSNYSVFNYDNKSYYNPVTNNNQTYTNIKYSPTYNTYNITNNEYNTYITNNYTYISYYIVDPVEELSWYYEIYYLLPDGRNSYDLKAEDVWGQYFIYDAVNYNEVAEDDGTTLALLHFDGNILDSSSHNCSVSYDKGANYNFVETNFSGGLYWNDNLEHVLSVDFSENLDGDFTIEGCAEAKENSKYDVYELVDSKFVKLDWNIPQTKLSQSYYDYGSSADNSTWNITNTDTANSTIIRDTFGFSGHSYSLTYYSHKVGDSNYSVNAISCINGKFYYLSQPLFLLGDYSFGYYGDVKSSDGVYFNCSLENYASGHFTAPYIKYDNILPYSFDLSHVNNVTDVNDFYEAGKGRYYFAYVRHGDKLFTFINGLKQSEIDITGDVGSVLKLCCDGSGSIILDELRVSNKALYLDTYTPSAQPFDTNLVLVVPETGSESTIAVKSNIPVANLRVGGVRPTYPTNGDVYVYLEDDVVQDVQQYQVDGWYSVTASIYEEGAWTPFNGKNLSTYTVKPDDVEGGGSDDPTPTPTPDPSGGGEAGGDDDEGGGVLDFLKDLFGGLIDAIAALIGGAVKLLAGVLGSVVDLLTTFVQFFSGFTEFLGAAFPFLPAELMSALTAGIIIMVVLAIIKFIGGFL